MAITEWTDGGRLDWSSEATIKKNPLSPYLEALRLACVERLMVCAPNSADSSWDIGTSPIWECSSGKPAQQIAKEIDFAIVAIVGIGFFGTQSAPDGIGWADRGDWSTPLDGTAEGTTLRMTVDDLVEKVTPGEPFYSVCTFQPNTRIGGGFDIIPQTEFYPTTRWVKQKYDMLNELTLCTFQWDGDSGEGVDVTDNPLAYHATKTFGIYTTVCGDPPTTSEWTQTEALWADVTAGAAWRNFGLGAYRKSLRSNTNQYYRCTIAPDFDMTDLSRQNDIGDDGFDFEKDIQVGISLTRSSNPSNVDIQFTGDSMAVSQFHNEVGAIDTYAELSAQTGHTGATWSASQFPVQTASPPLDVPKFPQVLSGFCVGHWVARRSKDKNAATPNSADLFHFFDYDKPSGFQFKL